MFVVKDTTMNKKLFSILCFGLLGMSSASAAIRPASPITSNMVLQQNTDARIWGTADPGEKFDITTSWNGLTRSVTADRTGHWSAAVPTPAGSYTPYTINIGSDITIENVLIGEVWLASGQSNMEMPLRGFSGCVTRDGYKEIAAAREMSGKLRFFTEPLVQSYEPQESINAVWTVPSPDTAPGYSAVAWHFAKQMTQVLGVPVGIVTAAYGGAMVESWTPRDILETYPDVSLKPADIEATQHYLRPMVMYNAMFEPIKNYTYKGIIWYQGCSNVRNAEKYAERLAAMVERWRAEIGLGNIPFYAIEIAPYEYDAPNEDNRAPLLRDAQWKSVEIIPNADMICINDLVEPYEKYNIHPANKEAVGRRLCDLALNKTYGKTQFRAGSPRYKSHRVESNKMIVAVDSPNDGICRNYDVRGFEIAGDDEVFYPADEVYFNWQTNEFVLTSAKVPNPRYAAYCYRDFSIGTLYGGNHLPMIPFRTY